MRRVDFYLVLKEDILDDWECMKRDVKRNESKKCEKSILILLEL